MRSFVAATVTLLLALPASAADIPPIYTAGRSKNAGPFRITLDILFSDPARYRLVRDSGAVTRETVARAYRIDLREITSLFQIDMANAIKITLRRPRTQGSFATTMALAFVS